VVRNDDVHVVVPVDAGDARVGAQVTLPMPKELLNLSPGFYMAIGDAGPEAAGDGSGGALRLYFNLSPAGAITFLRRASVSLNEARVAFRCKVLNDPSRFTRCDAVVLYVGSRDYGRVRSELEGLYPSLAPFLGAGTPAFTKRLADGVALAEDPGHGESFGMHRCAVLADAIVAAWEEGARTVEQRLATVDRRFAAAGLDLSAPFLNPGSADGYAFTLPAANPQGPTRSARRRLTAADALNAAVAIGDVLVREAIWHEGRCTWVGTDIGASPDGSPVQAALGADLYAGTSGVAVFLAALAVAAAGRPEFARTAIGAIEHALSRLRSDERCASPSLYGGRTGILLAAAYAGRLLGAPDVVAAVRSAADGLTTGGDFDEPSDVIAGRAGAIVGTLALAALLEDRAQVESAMRLGDELIERAECDATGWSWPSAAHPSHRALTGFAHGTAGVATALVELFAATGESRYRDAALAAFRWERHRFDRVRGNWLDLRDGAPVRLDPGRKAPFALHWCHGAPGIGLSRARGYQILRDPDCLAEAQAAAATTRRSIEDALADGHANYSLCHGLCGNADVVLTAPACLGLVEHDGESVAYQVGAVGIDRFLRTGFDWPCGGTGPSPGLMLGHAGIGYFYLRLHDRDIASPLLVQLWAPALEARTGGRLG
jgi:hypothetical protein